VLFSVRCFRLQCTPGLEAPCTDNNTTNRTSLPFPRCQCTCQAGRGGAAQRFYTLQSAAAAEVGLSTTSVNKKKLAGTVLVSFVCRHAALIPLLGCAVTSICWFMGAFCHCFCALLQVVSSPLDYGDQLDAAAAGAAAATAAAQQP